MTSKQLETKKIINKYLVSLDKINKKILAIRSKCKHPKRFRTATYKSDTGNYDPSQDFYWIENTCEICGKFWIEDQ